MILTIFIRYNQDRALLDWSLRNAIDHPAPQTPPVSMTQVDSEFQVAMATFTTGWLELLRERRLGHGKAAELAGLSWARFLMLMGRCRISAFDYDEAEVDRVRSGTMGTGAFDAVSLLL